MYASRVLGVNSDAAYKKLERAAKAASKYYPADCKNIVERIEAGADPLSDDLPTLPSATALRVLSTVLKRKPEKDQQELLDGVKSGAMTTDELTGRIRETGRGSGDQGTRVPSVRRAIAVLEKVGASLQAGTVEPTVDEIARLDALVKEIGQEIERRRACTA